MRIIAYSKALYATWLYVDTLKLLIDAGEGLNTHLEGRLLGIRDIALTHGHTDHFTGLHNILITRLRFLQESGDLEPVRIFWPEGELEIERHLDYLREAVIERNAGLAELVPLRPGQRVSLRAVRGLTIESFPVQHRGPGPCVGYRVWQERWRLRPELEGRPQREIDALASSGGREAVAQPVELPLLVVSGDTRPLPVGEVDAPELLIHESTFIGERIEASHSTLEEAVGVWRASGAQRLLLYHFSSRYRAREIRAALDAILPDPEERARVQFVAPGEIFERDVQISGL